MHAPTYPLITSNLQKLLYMEPCNQSITHRHIHAHMHTQAYARMQLQSYLPEAGRRNAVLLASGAYKFPHQRFQVAAKNVVTVALTERNLEIRRWGEEVD